MTARIVLAGEVGIELAGRRLVGEQALGGRRALAAFTFLVVQRQGPVSREELAEALWPGERPATWRASLRSAVTNVRRFLAAGQLDASVEWAFGCYRMHLPEGVTVDLDEAEGTLSSAERALADGDAQAAAKAADAARAVLARPILPGFDVPWLDRLRRRCHEQLVRALEVAADAMVRLGDPAAAAEAAQEAVALEPFVEGAHRAVMRAHAAAGNRGEALRAYERCRALLADELGVDPAPATQAVYLELLREEPPATTAVLAAAEPERAPAGAVDAGRAAVRRGDWEEAFERLSGADRASGLDAAGLEDLAESAFWTGRHVESSEARRRAHAAYLDGGDVLGAARAAMALVASHAIRMQLAVAEGWFRTAARLLEKEAEGPEHGFLAFLAAVISLDTGDLSGCLRQARRAHEAGDRFGVPDLEALGLTFRGCALARDDRLGEGLQLLDEAMAIATSGRLTPLSTGLVYCRTIWTCVDLLEYRRAAEWIETLEQTALHTGFAGYPGDCRAHRAAVLAARGSWIEAEREALQARDECAAFDLTHVGFASYTIGMIELRRGRLDAARAAFERANEFGTVPQPGIALLTLAEGEVDAALASLAGALEHGAWGRLERAKMLPALVEIAIAAGEAKPAREAADELTEMAGTYRTCAFEAGAAWARGAVALDEGDAGAAIPELRHAAELYRRAESPYDMAKTRQLLAEALMTCGDPAGAALELDGARALLARLGALDPLMATL